MRKKTFKVFLPIAVLGCVVSCSKMTSYQYGYDAHMTKENDIVKGRKTSFTAAHPSAGLDLNWETAGSYQWDDSSKAALVCVRTSPGDYYFNYDATEFPESERHRYMHPSVWLTLYQDSLGRQYSTLTSAVGDTAYLKKAGIDAMYISPLNMMDFTGDLLFFDMSKKLLGRVGYTDGRIDTSRAPVKRGLLVPAVMVSQAQGGDGDEPPNPGSTTVPVWDGQDISTLDEVIIKGWLPVYNYDPVHFCSYFPEWCMVRPCPYCGDMDCNGTDCTAYVRDTTDTDPVPPVDPDPDPDPSGPGDGGGGDNETPAIMKTGVELFDKSTMDFINKLSPENRAFIYNVARRNDLQIRISDSPLSRKAVTEVQFYKNAPPSYMIYYDPVFAATASPEAVFGVITHEFAHLIGTEMGLYPPDRTLIDVNDYQHDKMINTDFYRDILRQVYPGQDADFYKYVPYGGTQGSPVFDNLDPNEQNKIRNYLDKVGIEPKSKK